MYDQTINSNDSRVPSAFPGQNNENSINTNINNNNSKQQLKNRIKSANPKIKIKESKNSHHQKEIIDISKQKNVNEMFPDIYESTGNKNEEKPKITKVFRKTSSRHGANKDNGIS